MIVEQIVLNLEMKYENPNEYAGCFICINKSVTWETFFCSNKIFIVYCLNMNLYTLCIFDKLPKIHFPCIVFLRTNECQIVFRHPSVAFPLLMSILDHYIFKKFVSLHWKERNMYESFISSPVEDVSFSLFTSKIFCH